MWRKFRFLGSDPVTVLESHGAPSRTRHGRDTSTGRPAPPPGPTCTRTRHVAVNVCGMFAWHCCIADTTCVAEGTNSFRRLSNPIESQNLFESRTVASASIHEDSKYPLYMRSQPVIRPCTQRSLARVREHRAGSGAGRASAAEERSRGADSAEPSVAEECDGRSNLTAGRLCDGRPDRRRQGDAARAGLPRGSPPAQPRPLAELQTQQSRPRPRPCCPSPTQRRPGQVRAH